jgi:hypothetical protein
MTAYRAVLLDDVGLLPVVPVPVTLNGHYVIGRASAFLRESTGQLTCTVEIDAEALAKHREEMLEGCAWYAGEFRVQMAVGV